MNEEIDLTDRLRFAAESLAAQFGDGLTADHAEALVFHSAEGLLASASVTEFVPILAERRARLAVRSRATAEAPAPAPPPLAAPEPAAASAVPTNGNTVEPRFSVAVDELDRLRDRVDLVRVRVSDWRAELDRR